MSATERRGFSVTDAVSNYATCKRPYWSPVTHQHHQNRNRYMRATLFLFGTLVLPSALAAPTLASVNAEITALMTRLDTGRCEFNRNGSWYSSSEAKAHLLLKLGGAGDFQSAEQFIERVGSRSSMSGRLYLVRCGVSTPIASGEWLTAQLKEIRSSPTEAATVDAPPSCSDPAPPASIVPDDPSASPSPS